MNNAPRKIAFYALLTALGLILSYVEMLLALPSPVPGAKIGLANLVTMFALVLLGVPSAAAVSLLRVLLSGILFGNFLAALYSLAGCFLSLLVMAILRKTGKFGIAAVSAMGGAAHNTGQLLCAVWLAGPAAALYFPYLFIAGIVSGIVIGILGGIIVKRLRGVIQ